MSPWPRLPRLLALAVLASVLAIAPGARAESTSGGASTAPPPSGTPTWLFFATGGAAVLTLSAGSTLMLDAAGRQADEEVKSPSGRDPETRDAIRSQAVVGSAFLGAGAALAVATTVLAFTTKWSDDRAVTVGTTGSGLFLRGEF